MFSSSSLKLLRSHVRSSFLGRILKCWNLTRNLSILEALEKYILLNVWFLKNNIWSRLCVKIFFSSCQKLGIQLKFLRKCSENYSFPFIVFVWVLIRNFGNHSLDLFCHKKLYPPCAWWYRIIRTWIKLKRLFPFR